MMGTSAPQLETTPGDLNGVDNGLVSRWKMDG